MPNFSLDDWDTSGEIPEVAVRLTSNNNNEVPLFDNEGNQSVIPSGLIPGFPVLVVKQNERIVVDSASSLKTRSTSSGNSFNFKFIDDAFDGTKIKTRATRRESTVPGNTDPVNIEAYNAGVEWHRDYIYYGLTPTNTEGKFRNNYSEFLNSFTLLDDWYNVISDQSGDPVITANNIWTEGSFEFEITLLINSTNGIGSTIEKRFTARGEDVMMISYWRNRKAFYSISDIKSRPFNPDLELLPWDLQDYGATWKMTITEVDDPEEYSHTEETTVEYATNFEISGDVIKKIGLKFGGKESVTKKSSFSVKTTKSSDVLGSTILSFKDPVVVGTEEVIGNRREGSKTTTIYNRKEITTGMVRLRIEPEKMY